MDKFSDCTIITSRSIFRYEFLALFRSPVVVNELYESSATFSNSKNDPDLTPEQARLAEKLKNLFPSFKELGLDRKSDYQCHIIIKDNVIPNKKRHYPISQLVYEELDRMLRLGVIKESVSD